MPIIKWNPFWADDFFEDFLDHNKRPIAPAVDIYEKNNNIIAEVALPKTDPKNIKIDVDGGILTISAKQEAKSEVEEKNYYRKEFSSGSFYRAVRLPVAVKEDKTEANFKDGVLKITIPKADKEKTKKSVKIKVEEK